MIDTHLLAIEGLIAHYGAAQALFGIDLTVDPGETVALVGANGAGKTTLLKCIMGLMKPSAGNVLLDGEAVTGQSPVQMVRKGLALTPEGREVFPDLTVAENLELGAAALKTGRREVVRRMQAVFDRFGRLAERRDQAAGTLSGGEQQMLAMGRALMASRACCCWTNPASVWRL
jgi:phenylacetate-CoA ligase